MGRCSPHVVVLCGSDRAVLERWARGSAVPHRQVVRARIVLAAADGAANVAIAARLGVHVDTVSLWRGRFCREGLAGLADRQRSGRPRVFDAGVVAQVKALACQRPRERGVPLSRWSGSELAAQAVSEGVVESVSVASVNRWLRQDAIKPWNSRSWIFPRDRQFEVKAARVLDFV